MNVDRYHTFPGTLSGSAQYEGERGLVKDNHLLDSMKFEGMKSLKRGKVKCEVTFDLDHNGILTVTAEEEKAGTTVACGYLRRRS